MKQKEFVKQLEELNLNELIISVYWVLNEKGSVMIDEESIKEEFNNKLQEIKDILKNWKGIKNNNMEEQTKEIVVCNLECVLMPNGEIISLGKTIGYFKDFKKYLTIKEKK